MIGIGSVNATPFLTKEPGLQNAVVGGIPTYPWFLTDTPAIREFRQAVEEGGTGAPRRLRARMGLSEALRAPGSRRPRRDHSVRFAGATGARARRDPRRADDAPHVRGRQERPAPDLRLPRRHRGRTLRLAGRGQIALPELTAEPSTCVPRGKARRDLLVVMTLAPLVSVGCGTRVESSVGGASDTVSQQTAVDGRPLSEAPAPSGVQPAERGGETVEAPGASPKAEQSHGRGVPIAPGGPGAAAPGAGVPQRLRAA